MTVVLGIDAAWTAGRPSGVALVSETAGRWRLRALAPSYDHFFAIAQGQSLATRPTGSAPDVNALLAAAEQIAGAAVRLVAIDMPVSHAPITRRRVSDNVIASAFGAWHCATHSPDATRPGPLSDQLRADFAAAGYPLQTQDARSGGLIEVYPHPALVVLARETRRLPYKAGNSAKYWPGELIAVRRQRIDAQWRRIVALLATRFDDVADHLPRLDAPPGGAAAKAYEDMIDAIVCAWVGVTALTGAADPYGDAESAIWVPRALAGTDAGVTG